MNLNAKKQCFSPRQRLLSVKWLHPFRLLLHLLMTPVERFNTYDPYDMGNLMWYILYGLYYMDHIIWFQVVGVILGFNPYWQKLEKSSRNFAKIWFFRVIASTWLIGRITGKLVQFLCSRSFMRTLYTGLYTGERYTGKFIQTGLSRCLPISLNSHHEKSTTWLCHQHQCHQWNLIIGVN